MKAVIGFNTSVIENDSPYHSCYLKSTYTSAVEKAGGIAVLLPVTTYESHIDAYLDMIDGLILVGGNDLNPSSFGESKSLPTVKTTPVIRQEYDLKLAAKALERDIPIFGICMGVQVLNVAAGGTLIQDIEWIKETKQSHGLKISPYFSEHEINVTPDSLLHKLLVNTTVSVNSSHHQCVDKPAPGFIVSSESEDGIIESIEHPGKKFVLGVQWHPEAIHDRPEQLSLFRGLVEASLKNRQE